MILCIDTKDQKKVIVGLKEDGKIVKSLRGENEHGSEILLPLIVKLVPPPMWNKLDGIEVEEGQGSFTGLRVGASVAQSLGFALNIPVNGKMNKTLELKYTRIL